MSAEPTIKQDKFATLVVETGNKTEAAMQTYNCSTRNSAGAVANETLRNPKVQAAIQAKRDAIASRNRESEDSILAELNELKQLAMNQGNIGSAIKAVDSKTSILGLNKEPAANQKELEGSMDTIINSVLPTLYARIIQRRDAGEVIALPWE